LLSASSKPNPNDREVKKIRAKQNSCSDFFSKAVILSSTASLLNKTY